MPAQTDALANVYARSAFELAQQAGGDEKIAEIGDELEQICELARQDRTFAEFLASPLVESDRRESALRSIFANRVTDLTLRFLLVLNDKGRLRHLDRITAAYDALVQEKFGRVEVDVFTPSQISDEDLDALRRRIGSALGKEPVLHPYVDARMLGGIKLRIGDQLIDGSVSSRLRRLRQEMFSRGLGELRRRFDRVIEIDEN